MFKIGLDLGYGYVKGVNEAGKEVLFPSLVCEGHDRRLSELFGGASGSLRDNIHLVVSDGDSREIFVGDLAKQEGGLISFTLNENKTTHPSTKDLLTAAGFLLFPDTYTPVHLVTGLPLNQYLRGKDEFKHMLSKINVSVRHKNEQISKRINFAHITIFPQAAGAVYHAIWDERSKYFIKGSYLGLIDIGFKTTDFITFLVEDKLTLINNLSGTINTGISVVQSAISKKFTDKVGSNLDVPALMRLIENGRIWFDGSEISFVKEIEAAKQDVAKHIQNNLKSVWGENIRYFHTVFLAGGGAAMLGHAFSGMHANVVTVKNPQFANAKGFLKVAEAEGRRAATS